MATTINEQRKKRTLGESKLRFESCLKNNFPQIVLMHDLKLHKQQIDIHVNFSKQYTNAHAQALHNACTMEIL